ncbi:MAG: amidohydrolase family protein [Roseovarius sp.]
MTFAQLPRERLRGVLVPVSMIADRAGFGGTALGDCLAGDLVIAGDRALGLEPASAEPRRLVMPKLTEPHVHLDKCHTIDRIAASGGDLAAAIEAQAADRQNWGEDDLRARIRRGLTEAVEAGCGTLRSHVDWGSATPPEETPLAWPILGEMAREMPAGFTLQRAALTGIDRMADAAYAATCAGLIAEGGGVLGAFVFDQPERREGLVNTFREAERLGLALDFHVDEGLDPGLDGLEMIADVALAHGHQGPVLCGHGCSLSIRDAETRKRVAGKLARAGIALAVLPSTNLYLQGRKADARGLAPAKELMAEGVNVVLGADNVRDAFCPVGRHDPLQTLALGVLAAHLDPPFARHLPMITTGARKALGLPPQTVDGAGTGDLLLFDACSVSELLSGGCRPLALAEALQGEPR